MGNTFSKDPDAALDYAVDWADWLEEGDTLSASDWFVADGLSVDDDTQYTATRAIVWLSGGTAGTRYTATNHITTSGGREDERTLTILVAEQ